MPLTFACELRITTVDKLARALTNAPHWLRQTAHQTTIKYGPIIQERAQERAPVRTGRLRNSISWYLYGFMNIEVGSPLGYSGFVEFGTSRMAAQPYMRPAIEEAVPDMVEDLRDSLIFRMLEEIS